MRIRAITTVVIATLVFSSSCEASVDTFIIKRFRQIVNLIATDNAKGLAELINYPLKRERPLPAINDANAFISYYPTIFDQVIKDLVRTYRDSDILEHNGAYGLVGGRFAGEIWIDENGKISAINYSSEKEQQAKKVLIETIKSGMHASVKEWEYNLVFARSAKLLVRIDRTDKGLRYVCWNNGKTMRVAPDIILFNGVEEPRGTMGGWTWTFKNGDWVYVVDEVEMCETVKDCGLFLRLTFDGETKSTVRLTELY